MKYLYAALGLVISCSAFGQIQQNVNKPSGTAANQINQIDSIRFNGSFTEMEIILNNGSVESHAISAITNVTFSNPIYPAGTVHCNPNNPTAVVEVINPITGKTWMDRNLGASRVATSSTDELAYGDLYQWGRGADGHQCRNSPTTTTVSNSDLPGHGNFITPIGWVFFGNWRSPENTNLWQGVYGSNNPCPHGYRLPTAIELNEERESWNSDNPAGAYASPLKLTKAGFRYDGNGLLLEAGVRGCYWSSSISETISINLNFINNFAGFDGIYRAMGYSVRCLKDAPTNCPPTNSVNENFNAVITNVNVDLLCWNNIATVGSRVWRGGEETNPINKHAQGNSFNSNEINEFWLISPPVQATSNNNLIFESRTSFWTHNALTVHISTNFDGANPNAATWTQIPATLADMNSGNAWILSGIINLQNYMPQGYNGSFVVGFKYNGNGTTGETSTYRIDNVIIN